MTTRTAKIILCAISILLINSNAYAYLDPGTGSIIIQALLGILAAGVTTVSIYWTKFKSIISKLFNKKKNAEDQNKKKNIID